MGYVVNTTIAIPAGAAIETSVLTTLNNSLTAPDITLFYATAEGMSAITVVGSLGNWTNVGKGWYNFLVDASYVSIDECYMWAEVSATGVLPFQSFVVYVGDDVTASVGNRIADHVLLRETSAAGASGVGDNEQQRSLMGAVRSATNKVTFNENDMTIYKEDDSTVAYTVSTQSNSNVAPIVVLDP